jgi:hypothetical protein
MKPMRILTFRSLDPRRLATAMLLPVVLTSCSQNQPPMTGPVRHPSGPLAMHQGLSVVAPPNSAQIAAGETIYVPAYSSIFISDHADRYDLAITLAVRNTDPSHPIILTKVRYMAQAGHTIRDYLDKPIRVAPLASAGFFVAESDTSGGPLVSFQVEWVAETLVSSPIAETTMVGVSGTQGVSFVCQGRVIADRRASDPSTPARAPR